MNKAITVTPCSFTSLAFIFATDNNLACPGGMLSYTTIAIAAQLSDETNCSAIAGSIPAVLELSNATGDFSSPTVLFDGGLSALFEAIAGIDFESIEGINAYSLPANLPPGTNYLIRLRAKDNSVIATPPQGPFTVPEPTTSAITSLVVNDTGCPVQIQTVALGYKQVLTGDNGYIFSYVARKGNFLFPVPESPIALSFPVTKAGTYTLQTAATTVCSKQTVTVSKNCP